MVANWTAGWQFEEALFGATGIVDIAEVGSRGIRRSSE